LSNGARAQYIISGGCCDQDEFYAYCVYVVSIVSVKLRLAALAFFWFYHTIVKNILPKLLFLTLIASSLSLTLLIQFTSPATGGAVGILAVFILAYIVIVSLLTFFMYGVSRVLIQASRLIAMRKPLEVMSLKRSYYYSSVVSLAPVILVGMASVGALGIYEVTLVVLLVAIGCVYVTKRLA
jgi:hypothetical protein